MNSRDTFIENVIAMGAMILLLVFLCSQAKADEHYGNFFDTQPKLEYAFDAALLADMLTTNDIRYRPATQFVEYNPLLGSRPSAGTIAAYGLAVAGLHAAITYEMVSNDVPSAVITGWEAISIGVETGYVAHNLSVGLRFKF